MSTTDSAVDAQTNSTVLAKLDLPTVCEAVEEELFKSHHEKIASDYPIDDRPTYKPAVFLFNGGSYTPIPAGFVVTTIPLLIIDAPTGRAKFPQNAVGIPLQAGSVVCFAAGAEGVRLETLGAGKVVSVLFKIKA